MEMMRLYYDYILPVVVDWACSSETSMKQKEQVLPMASGKVLEIGIGSGNSLSMYDGTRVEHLTAIDPLEALWKRGKTELDKLDFKVTFIPGEAGQIPAGDVEFDTVVTTYTLCSIKDVGQALQEIHRVLKPGGKLIFSEHGIAPDQKLARRQHRVNPFWKRISGGCNLNRDIPFILRRNGFEPATLYAQYLDGWKLTSYQYWGWALKS